FVLADQTAEHAAHARQSVISIETKLAEAALDRVARRDPARTQHFMTLRELQALSPAFEWRRYAEASEAPRFQALNVSVPDYVKAFVEEAFGAQAKTDMLKMVQDIKGAMRQDIDSAPWMSGETKRAAMVKLNAVVDRIGYPEKWRDYAAVRVERGDALGNLERA